MNHPAQKQRNDKKIANQRDRITKLNKLLVYYREITETVREPFIILDKNLYVVTANLAFYNTFKVLKDDTEGRRIYDLGDNQWDAPKLRELLERILPAHRVMNNYEVSHDFPGLGHRTMLLNARQVDSKELILLAMEDVTAQRKLKVELGETTRTLTAQRDTLQTLSNAKDEFVSLASHQLRTPATVVKQYAAMLLQGYAGKMTADQKDMVHIVYESNERQLDIIEDLLKVARVDDGKVRLEKSTCNMVEQIDLVIKKQAILFQGREQTIVLVKPKAKILAKIDRKLMQMVLENLLDNAGKYSPVGSEVGITIAQDTNYTTVSVADKGVGILKRDLPKLFKKFSRVDNELSISVGGTGLGLYWAKKILDLHEGSIEVVSKHNVGSTFIVKIPIDAGIPVAKSR